MAAGQGGPSSIWRKLQNQENSISSNSPDIFRLPRSSSRVPRIAYRGLGPSIPYQTGRWVPERFKDFSSPRPSKRLFNRSIHTTMMGSGKSSGFRNPDTDPGNADDVGPNGGVPPPIGVIASHVPEKDAKKNSANLCGWLRDMVDFYWKTRAIARKKVAGEFPPLDVPGPGFLASRRKGSLIFLAARRHPRSNFGLCGGIPILAIPRWGAKVNGGHVSAPHPAQTMATRWKSSPPGSPRRRPLWEQIRGHRPGASRNPPLICARPSAARM